MLEDRRLNGPAGASDPDEPLRPQRLGRVDKMVDPLTRPGASTRDENRLDHPALLRRLREHPERAARERPGQIPDLQPEADVRFVAAETFHGFAVRQPGI